MDFAKKEGIARGLQFCLILHCAHENKITPRLLWYDLDDFVFMLKEITYLAALSVSKEDPQRYRKFF